MGRFNRGGKSGGFGGGKNFGKRDFGDRGAGGFDRGAKRQMYDAVCDTCGDDCQVPFRPTGDKPVFCKNCFGKQSHAGAGKFGGSSFRGSDRGTKQMFEAVCATCGNRCEVPFRPTGNKPVYCSNCFGKSDTGARSKDRDTDQFKEKLSMINTKLDKILTILNTSVIAKTSKGKENKKEPVKPKEEKKIKEEKKPDDKSSEKKTAAKKKAKSAAKKVVKKKKK